MDYNGGNPTNIIGRIVSDNPTNLQQMNLIKLNAMQFQKNYKNKTMRRKYNRISP